MIYVHGLENELHDFTDPITHKRYAKREEFISDKKIVKDILVEYCDNYGSSIQPYDGSWEDVPLKNDEQKYFFYTFANGDRVLVDIHIIKPNGQEICIKQDLSYRVEDGNIIYVGALMC